MGSGSGTNRLRPAVRKAIKRAIDVIDDANPAIAEVLRTTVSTGTTCSYTPDPRVPITWSTRRPDHGGHDGGDSRTVVS
jgi:hypothetical protein